MAGWVQYAGHRAQLQKPGDFITGELAGNRYIICLDEASPAHGALLHELVMPD